MRPEFCSDIRQAQAGFARERLEISWVGWAVCLRVLAGFGFGFGVGCVGVEGVWVPLNATMKFLFFIIPGLVDLFLA